MKITADTNILVRAIVDDDPVQGEIARAALDDAELVAVPVVALCEFVWALSSRYHYASADIARAIRTLLESDNLRTDRAAAEAGLTFLDAGRDFADGVIAHEGEMLGGEMFLSFDRRAVKLLQSRSSAAQLLA